MLFTTAFFVFLFLPTVLVGFFTLGRVNRSWGAVWVFVASVFFYGYWVPKLTLLLMASICVNFQIGKTISQYQSHDKVRHAVAARFWVTTGISANLMLLAYFKYANFFVENINAVMDRDWSIGHVVLPIGISFFTFTQIAFLADSFQKGVREYNFFHYGLFVTYFPHLIAGPVLHHAQMMPQFKNVNTYQFNSAHFSGGLAIFALGILKKIVLADGISPYADAVFKPSDAGLSPDLSEAWLGALAYTFQLYFDFSGYSDMAVGLSWMFNIRLPFNFDSPYRAKNISDFWRRWHMSLSNFLRDYLYIALGGNRHGKVRRYTNLMVTMVLGGLWHGASWSFVIWGFMHGSYLWINHGFQSLCGDRITRQLETYKVYAFLAWVLTMLSVIVAWVLFRAETLAGAGRVLAGMAYQNTGTDIHPLLWNAGLHLSTGFTWCCVLAAMAFVTPNSNVIGHRALTLCESQPTARALIGGASLAVISLMVLVNTARNAVSAFIYFNF